LPPSSRKIGRWRIAILRAIASRAVGGNQAGN
jgi:hypothetical protein